MRLKVEFVDERAKWSLARKAERKLDDKILEQEEYYSSLTEEEILEMNNWESLE